jgi:hypothetical protein
MSYVAGGGFISPERPSEILQPIALSYQTFKAHIGLQAALLFGCGEKTSLSFNTAKCQKTSSAIKLHIIYLLIMYLIFILFICLLFIYLLFICLLFIYLRIYYFLNLLFIYVFIIYLFNHSLLT